MGKKGKNLDYAISHSLYRFILAVSVSPVAKSVEAPDRIREFLIKPVSTVGGF